MVLVSDAFQKPNTPLKANKFVGFEDGLLAEEER
jgi:hypothetical protein